MDGLRAVAILLVVAFHARVPGFRGGFVGVDVFLVISGYLITRLLVGELESTGRISLGDFWLRRFRRLAPLLAVVIVATLLASLFVFSPLQWESFARQALAAGFYVSNIVFALDADRYFQVVPAHSPFLHTWSLGVEEQFYLAWPILVALAARAGWLGATARERLPRLLGAMVVASFALSLALTLRGTPWAFFSLPTRAWEFGVGGLLAVRGAELDLGPRRRAVLGWAGAASILAAAVGLDGLVLYPGWAVLLPALGTAALLLAGEKSRREAAPDSGPVVTQALSWPAAQAVGRWSYAWYLWHWPALALLDGYLLSAGPANVPLRCVVVAATLALAVASHHLVENPVRRSPRLAASRLLSTTVAALALGGVAAAALSVVVMARAAASDSFLGHLAAARATPELVSCNEVATGGCTYGDPEGERTVLLFGDSHAAQWLPALDRAAAEAGARLLARTYGGCPPFPILVARSGSRQPSRGCLEHRQHTLAMIERDPPDAVILVSAAYAHRLVTGEGELSGPKEASELWTAALQEAFDFYRDLGVPVGLVLDNPGAMGEPLECLARRRTLDGCEIPYEQAVSTLEPLRSLQLRAASDGRALAYYDPTLDVCDGTSCYPVVDGVVAYLDLDHLTRAYTLSRTHRLLGLLERVVVYTRREEAAYVQAAP